MREVNKLYNFCNFNLKIKEPNLSKNELSAQSFQNVDLYSSSIKTVGGFQGLFQEIFLNNESINNEIVNSFIYITTYDYYDSEVFNYKTIYFCIDKNYSLFKVTYENDSFILVDLNINFTQLPEVFTYAGKIYFYQKNEKFIYFENNQDAVVVSSFADFESYVNYYENSYFISSSEPYKVFYTEKTDIENLSDDLSVYSEILAESSGGRVLKLVSLKNNLYVVSQYAISKVVIDGDDYYLSTNCFIKSKIDEKNIFEINDYLMFFAGGKCFLFDGNEFEEIFSSETKLIQSGEKITGLVFDNKYYALARLNGDLDKSLLEFDIGKKKVRIFHISNAVSMYKIKSISCYKLVIVTEEDSVTNGVTDKKYFLFEKCDGGQIFGNRFVKFNSICFDDTIEKKISDIKTVSSGTFTIKISSENGSKLIPVSGNLHVRNLGLSGYGFDIEIYSEDDFDIKSILFKVQTITEQL